MDRVAAISALEAALSDGKIASKDRGFAESLVTQNKSRGLSEKQWYWVERLASVILCPKQDKAVADFTRVYSMLQAAAGHLKYPKINIATAGGRHIALYVAGERSRAPGVVNVVEPNTEVWYGRVHPDGRWEPGRGGTEATADVEDLLKRLAENPEKVAADYGRLSGACCFCNRTLKDERSTAVGYGKTCAAHFGLTWGKAK